MKGDAHVLASLGAQLDAHVVRQRPVDHFRHLQTQLVRRKGVDVRERFGRLHIEDRPARRIRRQRVAGARILEASERLVRFPSERRLHERPRRRLARKLSLTFVARARRRVLARPRHDVDASDSRRSVECSSSQHQPQMQRVAMRLRVPIALARLHPAAFLPPRPRRHERRARNLQIERRRPRLHVEAHRRVQTHRKPQPLEHRPYRAPHAPFARPLCRRRIRRPVHHWTLRSHRFQQIGVPPSAIRLRCHRGAIAERLAYQQKPIERSLDRPHRLDRDRSFPVFHAQIIGVGVAHGANQAQRLVLDPCQFVQPRLGQPVRQAADERRRLAHRIVLGTARVLHDGSHRRQGLVTLQPLEHAADAALGYRRRSERRTQHERQIRPSHRVFVRQVHVVRAEVVPRIEQRIAAACAAVLGNIFFRPVAFMDVHAPQLFSGSLLGNPRERQIGSPRRRHGRRFARRKHAPERIDISQDRDIAFSEELDNIESARGGRRQPLAHPTVRPNRLLLRDSDRRHRPFQHAALRRQKVRCPETISAFFIELPHRFVLSFASLQHSMTFQTRKEEHPRQTGDQW